MTSMFRPWAPVVIHSSAGIAYDATGAGAGSLGASSLSWTHTATSGAQALTFCAIGNTANTPSSVMYGSYTMTQLGSITTGSGTSGTLQYVYGLANAPGGSQTVAVTWAGSGICAANSVSYTGVSSVGTPSTVTGASQSVTCTTGKWIVQSFEDVAGGNVGTVSGGTNRSIVYLSGSSYPGLSINDATASTTFTSSGTAQSGIAVVLS